MWECNYAKEPVDYKLIWLRFLKKLWILPISMLIWAVIVSGAYYIFKVTAEGGRTYQAETTYYIDFAQNESGDEYEYFNYYTWDQIMDSDYFVDILYEKTGGRLTKDEIRAYVDATVEFDVRYLHVKCNTHSKELSLELARILESVVPEFAEQQKELASIKIVTAVREATESTNLRMPTAFGLGACIGLAAAVFFILLFITLDTSVYLPVTIERRYHLTSLGAPFMEEFLSNWEYCLRQAEKVALVFVGKKGQAPEITTEKEIILCEDPVRNPEEADKIRSCDATVLCLKAAGHNGKWFERCLEQLTRQDISVTAVILTDADKKLISAYYRSKK